MDYKLLFDIAVLAGEVMAKNGAETYRVEDTVLRILQLSKLKTAEVFVTMTGFFVTLDHPTMDSMTVVRRIKKREMNLGKIHEVNKLSRKLCDETIELEEALKILKKMSKEEVKVKNNYFSMIAIIVAFSIMLGGGWKEVIVSFFTGLGPAILLMLFKNTKIHVFLMDILCTTSIAIIANCFQFILGSNFDLDLIIIAAIMPFVPGVAITNAVFDSLHGDYLSGLARAMEALVIAVAIAIGIGFGMGLFRLVLGGLL